MIRSSGTIFYSLLYLDSRRGYIRLKYLYPVISVKIDLLPANTKNLKSTRSWTARVRFLASLAVIRYCQPQETLFEFECSHFENLVISNLNIDFWYHRIVQSGFAYTPLLVTPPYVYCFVLRRWQDQFYKRKFKPKSASSILQALSCRFCWLKLSNPSKLVISKKWKSRISLLVHKASEIFSDRSWRKKPSLYRRQRARPCLEKSRGFFLNWTKHTNKSWKLGTHKDISATEKVARQSLQNRACRFGLNKFPSCKIGPATGVIKQILGNRYNGHGVSSQASQEGDVESRILIWKVKEQQKTTRIIKLSKAMFYCSRVPRVLHWCWYKDLTSWLDLSSLQVCQVELVTYENYASKKIWELSARRRRCLRGFFGRFSVCSSLSKISVFGWTRCEICS